MYARRVPALAGVRGRLKLVQQIEERNVDLEDVEADDISEFESDFADMGMSYKEYKREMMQAKETLKGRIVASKYFKQVEPSFLTFIEKDQIRKLHKNDPEEWTIERLSESFPALPSAIKKILKSRWVPSEVETVLKYDNSVKQNWANFRAGKLVVSDALRQHLMKFKDRQISTTDRHLIAEKLVRPKVEFPMPKCRIFSSLVENSLPEPVANKENLTLSEGDMNQNKSFPLLESNQTEHSLTTISSGRNNMDYQKGKTLHMNKTVTFNEFVKNALSNIDKIPPEEGSALLNAHRKQIESKEEWATESENIVNYSIKDTDPATINNKEDDKIPDAMEYAKKRVAEMYEFGKTEKAIGALDEYRKLRKRKLMKQKAQESKETNNISNISDDKILPMATTTEPSGLTAAAVAENAGQLVTSESQQTESSLSTFIKQRISKLDMICEYAKSIKIPKNLFKPGMTYRVQDCYYDDDGEFLYRVPGLK